MTSRPKQSPSRLVKAMLSDLGFSPLGPRKVMSLQLSETVVGNVDLLPLSSAGIPSFTPSFSVSESTLGELVSQLCDQKYDPTSCLLLGGNLGDLRPTKLYAYNFEDEATYEERARELAEDVRKHALPFFEMHSTLPTIFAAMLADDRPRGLPSYKIPVGYHVLGNDEAALVSLAKQMAKLDGTVGPASEAYQRFADRLTQRITKAQQGKWDSN